MQQGRTRVLQRVPLPEQLRLRVSLHYQQYDWVLERLQVRGRKRLCRIHGSVRLRWLGQLYNRRRGGVLRRHLLEWVRGRSGHLLRGAHCLQQPDRLPKWQVLLLPRNWPQ